MLRSNDAKGYVDMGRSVRDTSGLGSYSKRNSAGASAGKSSRGETEEGVVRGWLGDELTKLHLTT